MERKIKDITLGALVADAYCLGTHWIYDQSEIQSLTLNWNGFNQPHAKWHSTKKAGQFTHYGDQLVLLWEYAASAKSFQLGPYMKSWYNAMRKYSGYVDGATQHTLDNIKSRAPLPCGFGSEDLSVVGRIAPLLALSNTEESFVENVDLFTRATHYTEITRACSKFCAQILWNVVEGQPLSDAIVKVASKSPRILQQMVSAATQTIELETPNAISQLGPACNAHQAMPGALHLLLKYKNDYKSLLVANAKAGGDSSARAMVAGMLMVAAFGIQIVPLPWREQLEYQFHQD